MCSQFNSLTRIHTDDSELSYAFGKQFKEFERQRLKYVMSRKLYVIPGICSSRINCNIRSASVIIFEDFYDNKDFGILTSFLCWLTAQIFLFEFMNTLYKLLRQPHINGKTYRQNTMLLRFSSRENGRQFLTERGVV